MHHAVSYRQVTAELQMTKLFNCKQQILGKKLHCYHRADFGHLLQFTGISETLRHTQHENYSKRIGQISHSTILGISEHTVEMLLVYPSFSGLHVGIIEN